MAINYSLVKLASKFGDKAGVPLFYARMLIQRYNIGGAPLVHFGTISTSCALFGSIMYTFARKRMLQNIQVAQLTYSSGSVNLLKWLCQITQVAQSASPAV